MPEAERALFDRVDPLAEIRNQLRVLAQMAGEWGGIPLPIEGERLRIALGYPFKEFVEGLTPTDPDEQEDEDFQLVNHGFSRQRQMEWCIVRDHGKLRVQWLPGARRLDIMLRTIGMASVWGFEQEAAAVHSLGQMLRSAKFKAYLLTGMFMESSPRSGLVYLFRRCRPTIAISKYKDRLKFLAALCLHPIGYYEDSYAGAMTPTDDVIAHLTMMRGDEYLFWKRSSQHPMHAFEAML